jgi:hypothetical protein
MESLVGEDEVLSCQTGITPEKDHNFLYNCWIALKVLQKFPEAVFLEVPKQSTWWKRRSFRARPE